MMKKALFFAVSIILFHLPDNSIAQGTDFWKRCGDKFVQKRYPSDSFAIQHRTFAFGNTQIRLIILHYHFDKYLDQAWIEQRSQQTLWKSKYLGGISGGEIGVAVPTRQPFRDFWLVYTASEFTGTYYLITKYGRWLEIPGRSLYYNKQAKTLYTTVPGECGGCEIGRLNLSTGVVTTKHSNGEEYPWGKGIDLSRFQQILIQNSDWVKWGK